MKRHIEINVNNSEELLQAERIVNRAFLKSYNVYGAHRDYYSERKSYGLHCLELTLEANFHNWKAWVQAAIIPLLDKVHYDYSWERDDEDEAGDNFLTIWGNMKEGL